MLEVAYLWFVCVWCERSKVKARAYWQTLQVCKQVETLVRLACRIGCLRRTKGCAGRGLIKYKGCVGRGTDQGCQQHTALCLRDLCSAALAHL